MVTKISKILLLYSACFVLLAVAIIYLDDNSQEDITPNNNPVTEVDLSSYNLFLDSLISDTTLSYNTAKKINTKNMDSSLVLVHTLRALSCNNCLYDNKYLINYLNPTEYKQMIWYLDNINAFRLQND